MQENQQNTHTSHYLIGKSRKRNTVKITFLPNGLFSISVNRYGVGGEICTPNWKEAKYWLKSRLQRMGGAYDSLKLVSGQDVLALSDDGFFVV